MKVLLENVLWQIERSTNAPQDPLAYVLPLMIRDGARNRATINLRVEYHSVATLAPLHMLLKPPVVVEQPIPNL
jgi:hypothetical protein